MSKLSVHLLTYNGQKYIPHCLNTLGNQTFQDFSVLIIDNASSDETVEVVNKYLNDSSHQELKEKARFVQNKKNFGFAGGHNQALHWTKSEYVLMLNQDIVLDSNYLKFLVEFLDKNPGCAAVTGKLLRSDRGGRLIDSCGLKIFKSHQVVEIGGAEEDKGQFDKVMQVFGVSGALPMYRRQALEGVSVKYIEKGKVYQEYFDNYFMNYKEDVDLAYRFCLAGWSAYLVPQAIAYHDRTMKMGQSVYQRRTGRSKFLNYLSYRNHLYFLIKNISSKIFVHYGIYILFYELVKMCYLILFEPKTFLKTWREVFKNLNLMRQKRRYIQKKWGNGFGNVERWLK
jgi:GT2 family glycosyltransferase